MATSTLSTIAQVLCHQGLPMNFARLVGDVAAHLECELDLPHKAHWDRETTVSFDVSGSRVIMDWTENPGHGLAGVLTLSAGPTPHDGRPAPCPAYPTLVKKLVALIEARIESSGVLWRQLACEITTEWMELLVEALPDLSDLTPPAVGHGLARRVIRDDRQMLSLPHPASPPLRPASEILLPESLRDPDLVRIRSALYDREEEQPELSKPMRLAVHAMNATLIMVWAPLGAVAMAHGVIMGEDLRRAAHMMVLSGLGSVVSQTPTGQQLLALLPML